MLPLTDVYGIAAPLRAISGMPATTRSYASTRSGGAAGAALGLTFGVRRSSVAILALPRRTLPESGLGAHRLASVAILRDEEGMAEGGSRWRERLGAPD